MSELLERTIEAHGGRDAWHCRAGFELEADVGGLAWPLRMRRAPKAFRARLRTDAPWVEVVDFGAPGRRGVFEPGRVWIEGESERRDPRASFRRLSRRVRWDDLDLLYFAGYAWWNYLAFPFMLDRPGFRVEERPGNRLAVRFPDGFPTHSPTQLFYLDDRCRLIRHDYTAHVFGAWARASHVSAGHDWFDGVLVPTRRRVYMRGTRFPTIISLDVARVSAF